MDHRDRPSNHYSEGDQRWQSLQTEQDQPQKKFYKDLLAFPNLFSLKSEYSELHNPEHVKTLLHRQEEEQVEGQHQYRLEEIRCCNFIIFFKFLLGDKQGALKFCEAWDTDANKSIIFLTLKAVLQWEFGRRQECYSTMDALQALRELPEFHYLWAVAESEKGYLQICIGPRGFLKAVDLFQTAIDTCPNTDIYLWKYDLALAIRRNFSLYAYSEHSSLASSQLAERALTLLKDVVTNCLNEAYKARAMLELARLISYLKSFCTVCEQNEKEKIERLYEEYNENEYYDKVLQTKAGKEDFYVLRECGRHFQYEKKFEEAIRCLELSYKKRESGMVCQVLGKTYLTMYRAREQHISPWVSEKVFGVHGGLTETSLSTSPQHQRPTSLRTEERPEGIVEERSETDEMLLAALDSTPYMDRAGNLLTSQAQGFGAVYHPQDPDESEEEEKRRLSEEFDRSVLLNEDGSFKTTEPDSIGNIQIPHHQRTQRKVAVQHSRSDDKTLHRKLLADFEKSTLLGEDGELKTTQPDGVVGNIRVKQPSENKPVLMSSRSYPPSTTASERRGSGQPRKSALSPDDSFTQQRHRGIQRLSFPPSGHPNRQRMASPERPRNQRVNPCSLLKSKLGSLSYNASDTRIQIAKWFYCKGCELSPYNLALLFDTGTLFEGMGSLVEAEDYYQKIVSVQNISSHITLVNAYERTGICLMKRLKTCKVESERAKLKARSEDMFMRSLIECRRAVVHLPRVSAQRKNLWESYPRLLKILHEKEGTAALKMEAVAHEEVGEHLKAIEVYQEVMKLAEKDTDRIHALLGAVNNYDRMGCARKATFILDLFLTMEEDRYLILTNMDNSTKELRKTAVMIYKRSGKEALEVGQIPDARSAFRTALLMKGLLPLTTASCSYPRSKQGGASMMQEEFELSVFYDKEGPKELEDLADCVASSSRQFFGIRVSVNNEDGPLGRLDFDSEMQLAASTPLVVLIVDSRLELVPRMKFLADAAMTSSRAVRVMVASGGGSSQLPALLRPLDLFSATHSLLALKGVDTSFPGEGVPVICDLFKFVLGD